MISNIHTNSQSSSIAFYLFFFFLMIRRPPRSTLFPYTDALPISRSFPDHFRQFGDLLVAGNIFRVAHPRVRPCLRSEEHTSELQSLTNLVCRLLLEKKKKQHDFLHYKQ